MIYTLHYPDLPPMAILRRKADNAASFEEYRSFREEEKVKTKICKVFEKGGGERAKPLPVNRAIDSLTKNGSRKYGNMPLLRSLSLDLCIPEIWTDTAQTIHQKKIPRLESCLRCEL